MFNSTYDSIKKDNSFDYEIGIIGNPNVGKSTLFNRLTGLNQHTGNYSGITVDSAYGYYHHKNDKIKIVDLPGTYSLVEKSDEERIANEYVKDLNSVIVVLDATNLQRNLNLLIQILNITNKVIVCLNFCDELKNKDIYIDVDELSLQLGVPVVLISALKNKGINELKNIVSSLIKGNTKTYTVKSLLLDNTVNYDEYINKVFSISKKIYNKCVTIKSVSIARRYKADKIICSKITGIPIMILLMLSVFFITVFAANYISDILFYLFDIIKNALNSIISALNTNEVVRSFLVDGIYTNFSWVVAVMLPPMSIFFPLFSLLEDSGVLPRLAFNLDSIFSKFGCNGKQVLTMIMGFGCNSCGVVGCRIIDSKKDKSIATITNAFMPCNGKLPSIISISLIFICVTNSLVVNSLIASTIIVLLITFAVIITLIVSAILSKNMFQSKTSPFVLEMPPYRKPQVLKTIIYSFKNRVLQILMRAVLVAIPSGAVIWLLANIKISQQTILSVMSNSLDAFGGCLGLDGVIILAFIIGFAANETVIPIILMTYLSASTLTDFSNLEQLSIILMENGWTLLTALCFITLCLFHYPCSTTCITIYKETKSIKQTLLAVIIPTIIGVNLCCILKLLSLFVSFS